MTQPSAASATRASRRCSKPPATASSACAGRTSRRSWKPRRWRASSMRWRERLSQFGGALAEQQPGDHEQLDLLRALEDVEDLDVAGPLLQQLALAVADRPGQGDAAQ